MDNLDSANKNFSIKLANMIKARFSYIYVVSFEEDRIVEMISSICQDAKQVKKARPVYTWSLTEGLIDANGVLVGVDTKRPVKLLEHIVRLPSSGVFILKDFHFFFNSEPILNDANIEVIRKVRDTLFYLRNSNVPKTIIFVSPKVVLPYELQKDINILEFSLPNAEDINNLLVTMIKENCGEGKIINKLKDNDQEKLVNAALGLTLSEAENSFALAMVCNGDISGDDVNVILEEKRQIIQKTGCLEFINNTINMVDVGGLENLKSWLLKRGKSWNSESKKYIIPKPKGVLLTGIPGCGKSLIAKTISTLWQLPLLRMDFGSLLGKYVGDSEANMRRALLTAEAVSPSVLWIDEIEKGFSGIGSSGDSGVATRLFGFFLTWMQEKAKPVFVVATANDIEALPPELLRKGRFDEIFFVDLPTYCERKAIFDIHLKKLIKDDTILKNLFTSHFLNLLLEMTEGFVGAEIEQVIISALYEAFNENRDLKEEDFIVSIKNTVPLSRVQYEKIKGLRQWASTRAISASYSDKIKDYNAITDKKVPAEEIDILETRGGRRVEF